MADDKIDDILVRLDEIEKLQTELRHLVPRVTTASSSSSGHHQDTFRDSSASIRFPSLFTFPVITNFASSPRTERVQKSAAQIDLNKWSTSGNRASTVNLAKAGGRSSRSGLPARGASVSREFLRSNNAAKLHGLSRNSAISTSAASSRASFQPTKSDNANREDKNARETITGNPKKDEAAKTAARSKTQRASSKESENNANLICCSVQTSASRAASTANSAEWSHLKGSCCRRCKRNSRAGTFVERVLDKLNYCFVDSKRVTVPCHYPGSWTPRRVWMLSSPIIGATEYPQTRVSSAKISVN